MNARSSLWLWLPLCGVLANVTLAQTNFLLTPIRAVQVTMPARESYDYQVFSSADFTNWAAASERRTSVGGTETFAVPATNQAATFFRGFEYAPDLSRRLIGLSNIIFDNAVFSAANNVMTLSGFRVASRDYSVNDYLKAQFTFDLARQTFALTNLQVFTNVGLVCGQSPVFFIKDATNALVLYNGSNALPVDTSISLNLTGQVMTVNLQPAQVLSLIVGPPFTVAHRVIVTGPDGSVLSSTVLTGGSSTRWWLDPINAFAGGRYTVQFLPLATDATTSVLYYHNANGHTLRTLTNGMNLSTSIRSYLYDYDKFTVPLAAGKTLTLGATDTGSYVQIFNSKGVALGDGIEAGEVIFTAPYNDTFYVIYSQMDHAVHTYSTIVSITP